MEKRFNQKELKTKSKTIIITGAESTGKSALTEGLANHFQLPFIPEFARSYIENLGRKYNYNDLILIAKNQIQQLNEFKQSGLHWIFSDTWLIITKIWFEEVFGKSPGWLDSEIKKRKSTFFWFAIPIYPGNPILFAKMAVKSGFTFNNGISKPSSIMASTIKLLAEKMKHSFTKCPESVETIGIAINQTKSHLFETKREIKMI
jgi:hypothetical protein